MESKISYDDICELLEKDYDSDVSGISIGDDVEIEKDDGLDENVVEEERCLLFTDDNEISPRPTLDDEDNITDSFSFSNEDLIEPLDVGQGDCPGKHRTYLERPRPRVGNLSPTVLISADVECNEGNLDSSESVSVIRENFDDVFMHDDTNLSPETATTPENTVEGRPRHSNQVDPESRPSTAGRGRGGSRGRPRGRCSNTVQVLVRPRGGRGSISTRARGRPRGAGNRRTPKPNYNIGWEQCGNSDVPPVRHIYNNYAHFRPPLDKEMRTEVDYWQLFFTDELISEITAETNRYASEKINKCIPLQKRSIWHTWREVSPVEMKAFFGVIINMAMHEKSEIREYFSEDWLDKQPFFKDIFSRDRFFQIFWTLHLCAPMPGTSETSRSTRAEKIRKIGSYLDTKFREHFCPGPNISVDESTVGFKGKVLFKCYNKLKPIKWGLRIYVLCDSSTGYICAMEPYFGSATTKNLIRPDLPFTVRIVLHLVHKLLENNDSTGLHVFTDRFYTSYFPGQELLKLNMHLTGTIMPGRLGLPDAVKKDAVKDLGHHEMVALRKNESLVLVWRDKRNVTMYSTGYDNSSEKINRIIKSGVTEEVMKPKVICEYNRYMGGVDIADNYISSYGFTRKSLKWWRKLFFWLIETSIVNAYILYSLETEKPNRHRVFRKNLVRQLVGEVRNTQNRKRGRPTSLDNSSDVRLNGKFHALYKIEGGKTRDCKVCSDRKTPGGRREASTFCKTCPKEPALHVGQCFEKYHTQKEFR